MESSNIHEGSPLVVHHDHEDDQDDDDEASTHQERHLELWGRWTYFVVWAAVAILVFSAVDTVKTRRRAKQHQHRHGVFPKDFVWGAATSAYQIEGATREDGRGASIWDTFCTTPGAILDGSNEDIACDHYHLMESDVKLMKADLGLKAYRFSIAWPRILPNGTGHVNPAGVAFYNRLIDALLENNIEPWVTLYHWDLPQALEDDFGGWLSPKIVNAFEAYARICFAEFGDRVRHWITINESWTVAVNGYNNGIQAPGHHSSTTEPYIVGHHLLLAHARAYHVYHDEFASFQGGRIGISHCADYRYPRTNTTADQQAAERAMIFQLGWFADPLFTGDYPHVMRQRLGSRLPHFTPEEGQSILGATDFLGLNHYSSLLASEPTTLPTYGGYWADIFVTFSSKSSWRRNDMGWPVVPDGCRDMLLWMDARYNHPIIYITENGSADEPRATTGTDDDTFLLQDTDRRDYLQAYLTACAQAIQQGVNLKGYFAWSLMDNFEWQFGYQRRFGLVRVNYSTQERTPKLSARWYRETILAHGTNLVT